MQALLKASAQRAGFDPKDFTSHSSRAGEASAMYHNEYGINATKRRWRWVSDGWKIYVQGLSATRQDYGGGGGGGGGGVAVSTRLVESYTPEQNEQLSQHVGGVLAHCMCCAYTLANIVVAWRSTQRVARSAQRVGGGNGGAMLGRDINVLLNIVPLPTGFIIN